MTRRRLVVAATSSSSLSISEGNVLGFRDCFCFFWLCLSRKKLAPAKNLFCARHISFCAGVEGDRALIARQGDVRLRGWRIRSWATRNLARERARRDATPSSSPPSSPSLHFHLVLLTTFDRREPYPSPTQEVPIDDVVRQGASSGGYRCSRHCASG